MEGTASWRKRPSRRDVSPTRVGESSVKQLPLNSLGSFIIPSRKVSAVSVYSGFTTVRRLAASLGDASLSSLHRATEVENAKFRSAMKYLCDGERETPEKEQEKKNTVVGATALEKSNEKKRRERLTSEELNMKFEKLYTGGAAKRDDHHLAWKKIIEIRCNETRLKLFSAGQANVEDLVSGASDEPSTTPHSRSNSSEPRRICTTQRKLHEIATEQFPNQIGELYNFHVRPNTTAGFVIGKNSRIGRLPSRQVKLTEPGTIMFPDEKGKEWKVENHSTFSDSHVQDVQKSKEQRYASDIDAINQLHEDADMRRQHASVAKVQRPLQETQYRRSTKWLVVINCIRTTHMMEMARAMRVIRRQFLPRIRVLVALRKRRAIRAVLSALRRKYCTRVTAEAMRLLPMFKSWPENNLLCLISSLQHVAYIRGEYIIRQGDWGSEMYFLVYGEVDVIIHKKGVSGKGRSTEPNSLTTVAQIQSGTAKSYFGEFAILSAEPRTASVRCASHCNVWKLHKTIFLQQLLRCPTDVVDTVFKLAKERRSANLKKLYPFTVSHFRRIQLFRNWETEKLNILIDQMVPAIYNDGEIIVQQGATGHSMFFITRGECTVYKQLKEGQEDSRVTELTVGDMFGEISVLFWERRTATIKAKGICDCWELHKDGLLAILRDNPVLFVSAKQFAIDLRAKRLAQASPFNHKNVKGSILFSMVKKVPLNFYSSFTARVFMRGDDVTPMNNGKVVHGFLILVSGEVVFPTQGSGRGSAGPGECIGEAQCLKEDRPTVQRSRHGRSRRMIYRGTSSSSLMTFRQGSL